VTRRAELRIRTATPADAAALQALAQRDSRPLPNGPLLVAESDGRLLAALSLRSCAVIADPFEPTAHLVAALRAHAAGPQSEMRESSDVRDLWGRDRRSAPSRSPRAVPSPKAAGCGR
jgi:hypothetical protein